MPRLPGGQTSLSARHLSKGPLPLGGVCQNELQNSRILESVQGCLNHRAVEIAQKNKCVLVGICNKSSKDQMPQLDTEELAETEYGSRQKIETGMETCNKAV